MAKCPKFHILHIEISPINTSFSHCEVSSQKVVISCIKRHWDFPAYISFQEKGGEWKTGDLGKKVIALGKKLAGA